MLGDDCSTNISPGDSSVSNAVPVPVTIGLPVLAVIVPVRCWIQVEMLLQLAAPVTRVVTTSANTSHPTKRINPIIKRIEDLILRMTPPLIWVLNLNKYFRSYLSEKEVRPLLNNMKQWSKYFF